MGLSDYSLHKWRKQAKVGGELAFLGNGKVSLTAEQQANVRLKKELGRGEFGAASAFVSGELSAGYTRDLTPDVDGDPGTGNFPRC